MPKTFSCTTSQQQQQQEPPPLSSSKQLKKKKKTTRHDDDDSEPRICHVMALGENWTGAFGNGKLDTVVHGHYDNDQATDVLAQAPLSVFEGKLSSMYDLPSVSAGWGHSAICAGDSLYMAGQAHDWQKLLRYKRLPPFLAKLATQLEEYLSTKEGNPLGRTLSRLMKQDNETENLRQTTLPVPRQRWQPALMEPLKFDLSRRDWTAAEQFCFLMDWTEVPIPEPPLKVRCSAGLSAVLGLSGRLYCFGQNLRGQCGVGVLTQSNIWLPQYPLVKSILDDVPDDFHLIGMGDDVNTNLPVVLPVDEETYDDAEPFTTLFLKDFALGLQHGVGLDEAGRVYAWGNGKRGQLGQFTIWDDSCAALRVAKYFTIRHDDSSLRDDGGRQSPPPLTDQVFSDPVASKPLYHQLPPCVQVDAGMVHSACLDRYSNVYLWGKNVLPPLKRDKEWGKKASDSKIPFQIPRYLLPDCAILQIACGSHHTAMLFEDGSVYAVGISTDTSRPLLSSPVCLIPPGVLDNPIRFFGAHMDRTTVICGDNQLIQAHLWAKPEFQARCMFTPAWVDQLPSDMRIEQVHRSWVHSLVVTTTKDKDCSSFSSPSVGN